MKKKHQIKTQNLARMLIYILGHRPDEFGLVPDDRGFVTCKELLQALHEEPGWGYARRSHIQEILLGKERTLFEIEDDRIRVLDRRWHLDFDHPALELPKILFICVRQRAHAHALDKGLKSAEGRYLVLSSEKEMALRMGRRRDRKPVLLEVMTGPAQQEGILFFSFNDLYLCERLSNRVLTGPPLPKDFARKEVRKEKPQEKARSGLDAGTFILDVNRDPAPQRQERGRKRKGWKEDARKARRRKTR